jgi:hypothetical protein
MTCEYYQKKRQREDLVFVCALTGRPCFVNEPDTALGRECQTNCTRRIWAREDEAKRTKSPGSTG